MKDIADISYESPEQIESRLKRVHEERRKLHVNRHVKHMSLCWGCANSVPSPRRGTGCEWSEHSKPVPGWDADPVILNISRSYHTDSFYVKNCPKFVPFRSKFRT